jgi:hypothetical protein
MTENATEQSDLETADYTHFKAGEKVRTISGEMRTVWAQRGYQVFVIEETDDAWYHAHQLIRIASEALD